VSNGATEHPPAGDGVSDRFERSTEYKIRRNPDLLTVSPGAQVRYTCQYRLGLPPTAIGGTSSYRDGARWYRFRARALLEETRGEASWAVPIEKGPTGEFHWDCVWTEPPGRYVIGSEISDGHDSTFCFLPQYVEAAGLVVGGSLEDLLKHGVGPSAAEAEAAIGRQIANLKAIAKRFPIADPAVRRRHDDVLEKWHTSQQRLRGLLSPTDGKTRIAIPGMHLETTTQLQRPLLLFLCHIDDNVVGHAHRKLPRWVLVDWTDPTETRFHGTYEGSGDTDEEAIRNAFSDWDWGNRYPAGLVTYELPAHAFGQTHRREMPTNGKSLGDEIKGVFEWIAVGGLVVAGTLLLFTPVPALAAGALGTSLLSSTAAATISIGQRWRAGIFDWRQDAFDGLTIVSNLFAGAGAWTRGARVLLRGKSGETVVRVFIGAQVGSDLVQGVLVAESGLTEWTELTENPDIPPDERSRRLLALIGNLASAGLLTYVSLRASTREVENLNKKPKHLPNEGPARSSGDKLADLTNPKPTVDTTKPPPVEGHTKEEVHETTVESKPPTHPKVIAAWETEFAKLYPDDPTIWKYRKVSKTHIKLGDKERFYFHATCMNGTLSIEIFTTIDPKTSPANLLAFFPDLKEKRSAEHLIAKELYPRMYKHFSDVGNPVRKLVGSWAWVNYADAKPFYDEFIHKGLSSEDAAKQAVLHARSWSYHEAQGFTHVLSAKHDAENSLFKFEITKPE
jgi:hypothetical protein